MAIVYYSHNQSIARILKLILRILVLFESSFQELIPLPHQSTTKGVCKVYNMETKILRVVRQGEAFSVQSKNKETGSIQKCNIVLRELGGSKFENEFVCVMLGNLAACRFYEGDVVLATLRFSTHEYQGQVFQEILLTDIVPLKK